VRSAGYVTATLMTFDKQSNRSCNHRIIDYVTLRALSLSVGDVSDIAVRCGFETSICGQHYANIIPTSGMQRHLSNIV